MLPTPHYPPYVTNWWRWQQGVRLLGVFGSVRQSRLFFFITDLAVGAVRRLHLTSTSEFFEEMHVGGSSKICGTLPWRQNRFLLVRQEFLTLKLSTGNKP
jgi:hypothetical protein